MMLQLKAKGFHVASQLCISGCVSTSRTSPCLDQSLTLEAPCQHQRSSTVLGKIPKCIPLRKKCTKNHDLPVRIWWFRLNLTCLLLSIFQRNTSRNGGMIPMTLLFRGVETTRGVLLMRVAHHARPHHHHQPGAPENERDAMRWTLRRKEGLGAGAMESNRWNIVVS